MLMTLQFLLSVHAMVHIEYPGKRIPVMLVEILSALVFALTLDGGKVVFVKSSSILDLQVPTIYCVGKNDDAFPVVLPLAWNGCQPEVAISLPGRTFFAFPGCTPFVGDDLVHRFADVVCCLDKLHEYNLAHCDVRLENFVKDDNNAVRLIDPDRILMCNLTFNIIDSVWYPRVLAGKLDWYQLGVSLVRLYCGDDDLEEKVYAALDSLPGQMNQDSEMSQRHMTIKLLHDLLIDSTWDACHLVFYY
eukprot:Rmarinus@m.14770